MGEIAIIDGGVRPGGGLKSNFYELSAYNIINNTAYDLGTVTISLNNITRISYRSVRYGDSVIDLYEVYSYDNLLIVVDSGGLETILFYMTFSLSEIPSYIIRNNIATPVGGRGVDYVSTEVISKLIELPNVVVQGGPTTDVSTFNSEGIITTIYACMDVFNNIIMYTDVVGYQDVTGLGGVYTYNVSDVTYNSDELACMLASFNQIEVYSSTNPIDGFMVLYTDQSLTTPYDSGGKVSFNDPNVLSQGNQYSLVTNRDGTVSSLYNCSSSPTPTPTPTLTPTPTPTPTPVP